MCQIWTHWWALVCCFCLMIIDLLYASLFYVFVVFCHAFRCPFVPRRWTGGEACCVHSLSCAAMAEQWWRNPWPLLYRQWVSHLCAAACLFMRKKIDLIFFLSFSWGNFQPQSIVKSLVPSLNTLVLFEVSPVSFHQVRRTAPAFHHCCAFVYRPLTCCVCQGVRGFHRRQVSFVSEWLVSRAIFRTSSALRRGLHPTEPTLTKRCKPDTLYLAIYLDKR